MRQEREQPTDTAKDRIHQAQKLIKEGFESLLAEMEQGHTERYLKYLDFLSRFHRYSPANQMLIFMQKPDATLVAGYRKWQELGYQVRRGEHGITIFAPILGKRTLTSDDGDEVEVESVVGFKTTRVFDASQLVNPPEDFWGRRPDDAEEQYQLVWRAVTASAILVSERPLKRGVQGESRGGLIVLREGMDSRTRTNTLIHEWAHEILHRQWMSIQDAVRQFPTAVRELQVESVAYIVSRYLGLDNPFSRDYLLHYGNTADDLMANMEMIQRASHYMIEEIEETSQKE